MPTRVCALWWRDVRLQVVTYSKEPWVNALAAADYDALSPRERLDALCWLVHTTLESPTVRMLMEMRIEDCQNAKKRLLEDAKVSAARGGLRTWQSLASLEASKPGLRKAFTSVGGRAGGKDKQGHASLRLHVRVSRRRRRSGRTRRRQRRAPPPRKPPGSWRSCRRRRRRAAPAGPAAGSP